MNNCKNCNKTIDKKRTYCGFKCQRKFLYNEKIKDWLSGNLTGQKAGVRTTAWVRKYLFEKFDSKCCLCGWDEKNPVTGKSPLEIDHIDGNSENGKEENLRLICPNCHSLTPTWKALNKGNANKKRLAYSKLI